jgi:hypothetical protein
MPAFSVSSPEVRRSLDQVELQKRNYWGEQTLSTLACLTSGRRRSSLAKRFVRTMSLKQQGSPTDPQRRAKWGGFPSSFNLFFHLNDRYLVDVTNERAGGVVEATSHGFCGGQKIFGRYTLIKRDFMSLAHSSLRNRKNLSESAKSLAKRLKISLHNALGVT